MPMSSRERVFAAIDHRPTDRMPADFGADAGVAKAVMARLGVADNDAMLEALHIDFRAIPAPYGQPDTGPDAEGYIRNMWGLLRRPTDPGDGKPQVICPFNEDTTVDEVHAHRWPDAGVLDFSAVRASCNRDHDRYVTVGAPWSPFFHEVGWLIGQENLFIWMVTRPDLVHAIIGHFVDYEIEATRRFFEAAAGGVDIAYVGNDFGSQRGLVFSPAMWQEFYRQPLKRYFDIAHDFGCRVMQHSCGAGREVIPSWIEDGVDMLDPVQVLADGMGLEGLVRDFGDRITFHGGLDTQQLMPYGTTADVRATVRRYRDLTRDRGGYVLTGSQSFIEDIPVDNILAAYDENVRYA